MTLNHNIFTGRNLFTAGLLIAVIFLLWVVFRGCGDKPLHQEEVKAVTQLQQKLEIVEAKAAADSARLARRSDSLQLINLDLKNKKDIVDKELARLRKDTKRVSDKLDTARVNNDTLAYITACDSLQERTKVQDEVIAMYLENDSLRTANYEAQLSAKDSLLANRAALIVQLRQTNVETYGTLQQVNKEYLKAAKKLRRERTLGRVLAGATIVLGGMLLIK